MKIKNLKLMLVGLLVMGSMNAFAAPVLDEDGRSVNGVNYKLYTDGDNKYAVVQGVNNQATPAEQKTITIPATVTGEKGTYKVREFADTWVTVPKDVSAVTTSLSIDVTNFNAALDHAKAFDAFSKLESLTITDTNAAKDAKTISLDCSSAGFKTTLKTLKISGSNIKAIADNGLKGFTALTAIDLSKIETIGNSAFEGCSAISSLTIPATVKSIGDDAFKNMYKAGDPATGLQTLVFNANDAITPIPAAFSGDKLLKSITITSATATTIATGAFSDATALETLDLSGCTKLATITDAFAASTAFKTVKLAGTDLTAINDVDFSNSKKTLEEVTLPAKITTVGTKFQNCVALKKIDLSGTNVKAIPDNAFQVDGSVKDEKGKVIDPVLDTVKLNAETTTIGKNAFAGQKALATIENLNNEKMATIDENAFQYTALKTVDLSATTALTAIATNTFADCSALEKVVLPKGITEIGQSAFTHCVKLSSLNLEDTKITTLEMLFTSSYSDESAPCDALKSLTLPETLTTVKRNALQMTGLTEITIPSSVTSWGKQVLQGCLNLKKFTWNDPDPSINMIGLDTFLGDDKLEEVYFITKNVVFGGISDSDFKGNDPARLKVYVNAESYAALYANGWTPANTKYATLVGEAETEFAFNAKGKSADGYYYATYYNATCDTWFPEADFEVFSAIVNGSKIELVPATVDAGYYKVAQWDGVNYTTSTPKNAVAVVRSKSEKANVEYKYLGAYESTMPSDNALQISDGTVVPSRLKFQYKLGVKDGQVKFWRITSGTLKADAVFIDSALPKAPEFLDIVIGDEATGIESVEAIETVEANDGAIYNLQGARVSGAKKGLYIQNGKKFIVK